MDNKKRYDRILGCALAVILACNCVLVDYLKERDAGTAVVVSQGSEHAQAQASAQDRIKECFGELEAAVQEEQGGKISSCTSDLEAAIDAYEEEILSIAEDGQETIDEIGSYELQGRQDGFLKEFHERSSKARDILADLKEGPGGSRASVEELKEALELTEAHNPLGNTLPYRPIEAIPQEMTLGSDTSIGRNTYAYVENAVTLPPEPQQEDTAVTDETQLTEEMKELADSLKTPLAIYNYVKNNIDYSSYYGSRKGAAAAFAQKSGNDMDQASLLIGMLRYLGHPARYVTGTVELTDEQAVSLTAAGNITAASRILASEGRDVTCLIQGGKIAGIRMKQTWVEAYVPYENYRGAGEAGGKSLWVPLDPSFKQYEKTDGVREALESAGIHREEIGDRAKQEDAAAFSSYLEETVKSLSGMEAEEIDLKGRKIIQKEEGYLPLSLQYRCLGIEKKSAALEDGECDSISIRIGQTSLGTYKTAALYGKQVLIGYVPAAEADAKLLEKYGSVLDTPPYLLSMRAVLKVDGETVAEGPAGTVGKLQDMTMQVKSGPSSVEIENILKCGAMYQITIDMGNISAGELQGVYEEAKAAAERVSLENIYTSEYLGTLLELAGKLYFAQLDVCNHLLAEEMGIRDTRELSVGMTGYDLTAGYLYGMPCRVDGGSLFIDVDLDCHAVVSLENDQKAAMSYITASGMTGSSFEDVIWAEITGVESVSTMKALEEASEQEIEVLMISRANMDTELEKLSVGSGVYRDIENAVNAGRIVTVPRRTLDIGSWRGSGYIVTDPETGEAGYLISGGIAGGSTATDVDLAYLVDILFSIWDMGESVLLVTNALAAIEAGTALAGGIFLILGIVSLVFALCSFVETVLLMDAYQNGNEQAGQELIKNSMINIGVTMATAALRHLAKPVVKYAAKNKLVREFGEGFVEKLAEHTDDFAGVKKGIRKLQKLGVSDDILREMGERFGTDGYDWLLKKRPLGLDNDILRKLTQADSLMDYSDELLDAVKNSDGHADDIIKAVSTYGDEAADAIVKYGDEAADIIAKHGEDGLSWIKKYEM